MTDNAPERPSVADMRAETARILKETSPAQVALAVITFPFLILGWILGRAWWAVAELVVMCAVAGKWGYWQGAKVPPEQRVRKQAPRQP